MEDQDDESEDFITCSVCFLDYEAETRLPKLLPCGHTICIFCLEVSCMIYQTFINCLNLI